MSERAPEPQMTGYIPTTPPTRMSMPFKPDSYQEEQLSLDLANEQKLRKIATESKSLKPVVAPAPVATEDIDKTHFWQG